MSKHYEYTDSCVAVIGMALRFPGAANIEEFWQNLLLQKQSMKPLSTQELRQGPHAAFCDDPQYVPMISAMDGYDLFDADFFKFSPQEAAIVDPQQRLLLEYCWKAFEHAGHKPQDSGALRTGVFASGSLSSYMLFNLHPHIMSGRLDMTEVLLGNDKDYLASRVAYKLGLQGPAVTIQSACSSSLTSLHTGCQSLLAGECDRALVGSVSLPGPPLGYIYLEGGMRSPDGRCRPYDADAKGTIFSSGVAAVLLKRLADARADNDNILGVIRASAVNNDGRDKVGFTAPSLNAQAAVISESLNLSGVNPWDIDFIEGHGTATPMGDPIEVAALRQAYSEVSAFLDFNGESARPSPGKEILLGSVKGNIGHLDATSGLAGFIKAILTLEHGIVPGTANFQKHNPLFGDDIAPFAIRAQNSALSPHKKSDRQTETVAENETWLGGVSSFGIGGTNVHVIVQNAPPRPFRKTERTERLAGQSKQPVLLLLSGKDAQGLQRTRQTMAQYLEQPASLKASAVPDSVSMPPLEDMAYTLLHGRIHLPARQAVIAATRAEALAELKKQPSVHKVPAPSAPAKMAFLFPGQGTQHLNLGKKLYTNAPLFKEQLQNISSMVTDCGGPDIEGLLLAHWQGEKNATEQLSQTAVTQPLLFAIEYSLARLLMANGCLPAYLLGHSIGEYTAACIANVFSLPDAARLVTARGRIMQQAPEAGMLVVSFGTGKLSLLPERLRQKTEVAVMNSRNCCVLAGEKIYLEECAAFFEQIGEKGTLLRTSHAFHSSFMEPVLEEFRTVLSTVSLSPPQIPLVSNLTGTWISNETANPGYWVRHLRETVRFSQGLQTIFNQQCIGVEVGPGKSIASFAQDEIGMGVNMAATLGSHENEEPALALELVGKLWETGADVDWPVAMPLPEARLTPVPGYEFARRRHWIEAAPATTSYTASPLTPPQAPERQEGTTTRPQTTSTSNGANKTQSIAMQARSLPDAPVPGTTPQEQLLIKIWEELLFVQPIGVRDNFIELGGNSMHVLRMVRLAAQQGLVFNNKDVFEGKTIAGICARLSAKEPQAGEKKQGLQQPFPAAGETVQSITPDKADNSKENSTADFDTSKISSSDLASILNAIGISE